MAFDLLWQSDMHDTNVPAPLPADLDLVCWSHLRWGFVFQRPQHLMVRFARERRVFFVEEPVHDDSACTPRLDVRTEPSGVRVVVPRLPAGMLPDEKAAALAQLWRELYDEFAIQAPICWYYSPLFLLTTRELPTGVVVYDCMDELSAFHGAPPILTTLENELFSRAHLVLTGGRSLFEHKRTRHPNVHLFASSVDAAHFGKARALRAAGAAEPEDQAGIAHPRIGFFGVIDERMDIELVRGVAAARPQWQIVLIGPIVKIDPATVPCGPASPNVHLLGMKKYDELPGYLAGWDVAFLPFAFNGSTRFISPTKTPEYMAGGCPVVSTPIRDVVSPYGEQNLVAIARDAQEMVAAIERILLQESADHPGARRRAHDAFLATMSWDRTYDGIVGAIAEAQPKVRAA